jgi:amino acid transporter
MLLQLALLLIAVLTIVYCALIRGMEFHIIANFNEIFLILNIVLVAGMVLMGVVASVEKNKNEETLDNKLVKRIKEKLS